MQFEEHAEVAKKYYDSAAHEIYKECWGGENHHLGLFDDTDDFFQAAQKANENLVNKLQIKSGDKVLDIGSGFCGLPRFIANTTDCSKVVALNISEKENEYARKKNKEEGLDHLIDVIEGDFNDMPFSESEFDAVVSQDAMLHSPDKKQLVEECSRILQKDGFFVFSDILEESSLSREEAEIVYSRINVPHLSTFEFYEKALSETGFYVEEIQELGSDNLGKSYKSVYDNLNSKKHVLMTERGVPEENINNTLEGLQFWVDKAFENKINWGLFVARKL